MSTTGQDPKARIIVALDGMDEQASVALARTLSGKVWGFKVNDLLVQCGVRIIEVLRRFGSVFADPKFHDIPNTVANGVQRLEAAGASLITVHASGGGRMLEAAAHAAKSARILAVTVLTSINEDECRAVYGQPPAETVLKFASSAQKNGVHGIVLSPQELSLVASLSAIKSLLKVTPGVRPSWHRKADDQSRISTPDAAIAAGADLLVIGRPITEHTDPIEAVRLITEELR